MVCRALLVVDVQIDFCPGGALPVPDGDKIIFKLNRYIDIFHKQHSLIFASRDWHPAESKHFLSGGGKWPPHCIRNTIGAKFHPELHLPDETIVISKGLFSYENGYSAFQGFDIHKNTFRHLLDSLEVRSLYIGGLATEYCVKASSLEALKYGFEVFLLTDATKGVNVNPSDTVNALEEMKQQGIHLITIDQLKKME